VARRAIPSAILVRFTPVLHLVLARWESAGPRAHATVAVAGARTLLVDRAGQASAAAVDVRLGAVFLAVAAGAARTREQRRRYGAGVDGLRGRDVQLAG